MKLESLSLFFPCHNEEANVEGVVRDAIAAASRVTEKYEVIVVDDGSTDRTAEIVGGLMKNDPRVRLVRHPKNKGYGEALKTGFSASSMDWIFYTDGDGQFNLDELPSLTALANEADIVSGIRTERADSWHRKLNARIFEKALGVFFGLRVPDVDCAFKLYRRDIFKGISLKSSGAMIDAEVLTRALRRGSVIKTVGVSHRPRVAGKQTGANPKVILRAMKEFWRLWWDLRDSSFLGMKNTQN